MVGRGANLGSTEGPVKGEGRREMSERVMQTAQGRGRVWLALALAVTLSLALMFLLTQGALAEDPTPEATAVPAQPPLGDCYGGVLSHAPLHCYALEQAEAAEVIDVDSIYLAGARLYIYVGGGTRTDIPLGWNYGYPTANTQIHRGIGAEMKEFARLWPEWVDLHRGRLRGGCLSGESDEDCLARHVDSAPWGVEGIIESMGSYDSTFLMAGNSDTRRTITGWAGWTQLWPATQQAKGQDDTGGENGQRASTPTSFDISGVDTTNFPELNCYALNLTSSYESACKTWSKNAEIGIDGVVGVHSTSQVIGEGTLYIQMYRDPDDLEAFEAARAAKLRRKPADWQSEWVIIPVKYSFPDLWKWGVILDRFAESQGNTIGILHAGVHNNTRAAYISYELGLYLEEGSGGVWSEGEGYSDPGLVRETISILALDPYVVRDALPVLLPQLGIPVHAVGVILKQNQTDEQIRSAGSTATEIGDDNSDTGLQPSDRSQPESVDAYAQSGPSELSGVAEPAEGSGIPIWVLILIVAGAVAMVLVLVGAGRAILRRRAS